MRTLPHCFVAAVAAAFAGAASATEGTGWIIDLDYGPGRTALSPDNPSVRVTLRAFFDERVHFAIAGMNVNVRSGESGWSQQRNLAPLTTGASPGVVTLHGVNGIIGGQLNFPSAGIFADPANPCPAWTAVWTATDFRTREVRIETHTVRFDLYGTRTSPNSVPVVMPVSEGWASVRVVPAPAAAVGAACLLLVLRRTRGAAGGFR